MRWKTFLLLTVLCVSGGPLRGEDGAGTAPLPVEQLLKEASSLAEEARGLFQKAHEMPPAAARNETLSKVRQLIKHALDKYRLVSEVAPEREKDLEDATTDLKGMLFWCNKSMVVVLTSPPPAAADLPHLPAPPAALTETQLKDVESLCTALCDLFQREEACRDEIARHTEHMPDLRALIDQVRAAQETGKDHFQLVKAAEGKREALLSAIHHSQQRIQDLQRLKGRTQALAQGRLSKLEYYQEPGVACMAEWTRRRDPASVPEAMVSYVNAQLAHPAFSFTPVPPEALFPREYDLDPAKREELTRLLKALDQAARRIDELNQDLSDLDAQGELLASDAKELETHGAWRRAHTPLSEREKKDNEGTKAEYDKRLAVLPAKRDRLLSQISQARAALEELKRKLDATDPAMVRMVEGWRKSQGTLLPSLEDTLEDWTCKALGKG